MCLGSDALVTFTVALPLSRMSFCIIHRASVTSWKAVCVCARVYIQSVVFDVMVHLRD